MDSERSPPCGGRFLRTSAHGVCPVHEKYQGLHRVVNRYQTGNNAVCSKKCGATASGVAGTFMVDHKNLESALFLGDILFELLEVLYVKIGWQRRI